MHGCQWVCGLNEGLPQGKTTCTTVSRVALGQLSGLRSFLLTRCLWETASPVQAPAFWGVWWNKQEMVSNVFINFINNIMYTVYFCKGPSGKIISHPVNYSCTLFFFWLHCMACGNLRSLTKDQTGTPCIGKAGSYTGPPGKSCVIF